MKNVLVSLLRIVPLQTVYAHCDIPCGIYDPHQAQLAAHTVMRMTQLIQEAKGDIHKIARMTRVKEEHGKMVEEEIVTLWADYFKEEHLKEYPDLHSLIWKTIKISGKARQEVNMDAAQELLTNTQKIAEIFWKTKKIPTIRIHASYPTGDEIVLPTIA